MDVARHALGSNYELVSLIGTGAMGEVWRARDRAAGIDVAAKVLRSEYARNPDIVGRFVQERAILLALDHPSIVGVRDLVVEADRLAIVMDLVEGQDLRGALRAAGTLRPAVAARVTARILEGLSAAHAEGAVHRDVKPDNVLVTADWPSADPGSVRLTDFGIARLAQDSTVQATGLLGTPEYMPPELFEHGTASTASDVYAAGVVLYELLAGRTPFAGEGTAFTIGNRAVTVDPPPLDVPPRLWQLLTPLLAKDPRRRPKASDAAAELLRIAAQLEEAAALPVQPTPTTWRRTGADDLERQPLHRSSAPATFDPGVTNLDATVQREPVGPMAGAVQALAPTGTAADLEVGATNVGLPGPATYVAPTLEPAVEKPAPARAAGHRTRTLLVPGGALALVLLVVGGYVLLRPHGGGAADGPSAEAVTVTQQDSQVEGSGLEVSRTATYDPVSHQVELKLELGADRIALHGPFLQVLPRAGDAGDCPLASWDGARGSVNDIEATGVTAACGYSLDVPTIPAGEVHEAVATLSLDLGDGDPEQLARTWLADAADATTAALENTGANTTAYGAQRLFGIAVEVGGASMRQAQLRVGIYPEWPTGVDRLHPLFLSSSGQTTLLLDQVGGGLAGLRLYPGCDAVKVNSDRSLSPLRQTPDCSVVASVGNLKDVESNSFAISGSIS